MFTNETTKGYYENVHRSISHDVILIQSITFAQRRLPVMEEYFEIKECGRFHSYFTKVMQEIHSLSSDWSIRQTHPRVLLWVKASLMNQSKCLATHHAQSQCWICQLGCGKNSVSRSISIRPRNASGTKKGNVFIRNASGTEKVMYSCCMYERVWGHDVL